MTPDCFLCEPDPELLIGAHGPIQVIAGLGPLTECYVVVGTCAHIRCMADAAKEFPDLSDRIEEIRAWLVEQEGGTFSIAEHGRIPVCDAADSAHDAHCYHAHHLFFQTGQSVDGLAGDYFLRSSGFTTLSHALVFAAELESYVMTSARVGKYVIHDRPTNLPRQLVRSLVAHRLGEMELADWRRFPQREIAVATATRLRPKFAERF